MRVRFIVARDCLAVLTLGMSVATALAQSGKLPHPADVAATVPAVKYQSVFSDYRPYEEQQLAPWKQVHEEVAGVPGAAGHAGHGATASPMAPQGPARMSGAHEGHAGMMMAKPPETSAPVAEPMAAPTGAIIGTGVILQVDKANAKVKMTHDPIAALGWPKMTMFFRLKDRSLADQVKEGEAVQFLLEKSGAGYVISDFGKPGSGPVEKK